jgi:hypothetical protein
VRLIAAQQGIHKPAILDLPHQPTDRQVVDVNTKYPFKRACGYGVYVSAHDCTPQHRISTLRIFSGSPRRTHPELNQFGAIPAVFVLKTEAVLRPTLLIRVGRANTSADHDRAGMGTALSESSSGPLSQKSRL